MCQVPMFTAACQEPDAMRATPGHKGQLNLEWISRLGFLGLSGSLELPGATEAGWNQQAPE